MRERIYITEIPCYLWNESRILKEQCLVNDFTDEMIEIFKRTKEGKQWEKNKKLEEEKREIVRKSNIKNMHLILDYPNETCAINGVDAVKEYLILHSDRTKEDMYEYYPRKIVLSMSSLPKEITEDITFLIAIKNNTIRYYEKDKRPSWYPKKYWDI